MKIIISKNALLKICVVIIAVLLISNGFLLHSVLKRNDVAVKSENPGKFDLLYPTIASMETSEFNEMRKFYITNYFDLKDKIIGLIDSNKEGEYSIYFDDINTGAWIGINEKERHFPGSLLKIPVVAAVLKRVDEKDFNLDSRITILEQDVDTAYGPLAERGAGYDMSVEELINYSIYYSDNTANAALRRIAESDALIDSVLGLGLPYKTFDLEKGEIKISVKDYSNILRSLYYSSYLRRFYSQYILDLMTNTAFNDGLPSGVPKGVKIAHKIGDKEIYYYDCGIIYYPENPYILCVMTGNAPSEKSIQTIGQISKLTYDYVDSRHSN